MAVSSRHATGLVLRRLEDLLQENQQKLDLVVQAHAQVKADQLIDHCAQIVQELLELRLKYRASHSTSGLPPNIDALTEILARIELRRRLENRIQE